MLTGNKVLLFALFLACASVMTAQKALEKPIDEWTKSDTMAVLNESAWAKIYQSIQGAAAADASRALRAQADNRLAGSERGRSERTGAPPPIVLRLHSGLPIRLALTRLNQIGSNYEKMNEKDKAEFNQAGRKLLDCAPCQNHYVVSITQFPNPSGDFVEEAIFQGMTFSQMKGNVRLKNDRGETRELVHFIAPTKRGDSAVFFFSRKDDKGSPFLNKDNTGFEFIFDANFFTASNRFAYLIPRQFDFKLSKITIGDTIVF